MANFFDIAPKPKTPAARNVCVDKIGSRPRGILCVPKIRPGGRECAKPPATWPARRAEACQTYRDIPSKPVKATIVLFYWLTRAWRELEKNLIKSLDSANDVRAARRPGSTRRLPSPPSMHPHLPTLARAPPTRFTLTHPDCHNFTFVRSYRK